MMHLTPIRRWLVLFGIACSMFVCAMDLSIVNTALPVIQKEFNTSISQLQWIVNAYAIAFAILLVTSGRLADIFGRRKVLAIGLLLFGFSSLACGLAPNPTSLIWGRGLQGLGGSIIFPVAMALFLHAYPAHQKARAMGLSSAVISIGMAFGPVIGGLITDFATWRWIFLINPFVAALSLLLLFCGTEEIPDEESRRHPIDWSGLTLLVIFLLCLALGIIEGPSFGWTSGATIGLLIGAAVTFLLFLFVEKRAIDPIIPLHLFTNRIFIGCSLTNLGVVFFWMTSLFLIPLLLFNIYNFDPLTIGMIMLILALPVTIISFIVPRLTERVGPRLPMLIGFLLLTLAGIIQNFVTIGGSFAWLALALILTGTGAAIAWAPSTAYAVATLPKRLAGTASGSLSTIQEMGGAIGLAISTTLFRAVANNRATASLTNLGVSLTPVQKQTIASSLSEPKTAAAAHIADLTHPQLFTLFENAFVDGYYAAMWLLGASALAVAILIAILIPRGPLSTVHEEDLVAHP